MPFGAALSFLLTLSRAGPALALPAAAPRGPGDLTGMGEPGRARALGLWSLLVYAFLYAPLAVLTAFSFNQERLTATWRGFTLEWYGRLLENTQVLTALRNSLLVAVVATAGATAIGTAAALAFYRHRFRRQGALDGLVTLPIVIPEIAMASSLLLLFAALGLGLGLHDRRPRPPVLLRVVRGGAGPGAPGRLRPQPGGGRRGPRGRALPASSSR